MKKFRFLMSFMLVAVFAISLGAAPVLAAPNTKVDLVEDSADGAIDMLGPVVGFVNTNQNDDGDLRVVVKLKDATPLTTYTIYLTGGPTHDTATGFIVIGTLTTDEDGNGNSGAIWTDAATMATATFGNGPHHVDMLGGGDGKSFTASPILYTLP